MPGRHAELFRRPGSWLAATGLLALAPKCGLCVTTYLGMGAALGLVGPELCGGSSGWAWSDWLAAIGTATGGIGWAIRQHRMG